MNYAKALFAQEKKKQKQNLKDIEKKPRLIFSLH